MDPSFALAYAGLADSYLTLGAQAAYPSPRGRHASESIHKALQLDESLGQHPFQPRAVHQLGRKIRQPDTSTG